MAIVVTPIHEFGDGEPIVSNSGLPRGSQPIRPVNLPIPVNVRENVRKLPVAVHFKGRWGRVVSIDEVWH
jgi:hypothetical protein